MKTYKVSDLFFTKWKDLSPKVHAIVYTLLQHALQLDQASIEYGYAIIQILRNLRKNKRLVNKINVEQAVDIFNDLSFLHQPWFHFPFVDNRFLPLVSPDEKMARSTFDQFLYADNEFSSYLIDQDEIYLRRLVVTLYPLIGEKYFDKEDVKDRAAAIEGALKPWQLNLVFFTFSHIRTHVVERCKTLLPKMPVRTGPQEEPEPPRRTGAMWYEIKHHAARTLVFGTFDQIGRANMYSVLDHLEILAREKANAKP